uniref:Uncharacterized protein n=1 Tax=Panagrolaimus sp. ES5 TaxID=591445 RepID=A0AC34EZR6_9BILA
MDFFRLTISFCCIFISVNAATRCVRAEGRVTCPTDNDMASNVEVRLLDRDSLPWETDDLMGSTLTDANGNYIVEGCGDDVFNWNDPDPYIELKHRCPLPGHTVTIPHRFKEIEIAHKFLPEKSVEVENVRLDLDN